jgi:hypothetical protein
MRQVLVLDCIVFILSLIGPRKAPVEHSNQTSKCIQPLWLNIRCDIWIVAHQDMYILKVNPAYKPFSGKSPPVSLEKQKTKKKNLKKNSYIFFSFSVIKTQWSSRLPTKEHMYMMHI